MRPKHDTPLQRPRQSLHRGQPATATATASSGTSASAVASAAWRAGWIDAGLVQVRMPGGTAPVRLVEQEGVLQGVALFGTARRVS